MDNAAKSQFRLKQAEECLAMAQALFGLNFYKGSVNRCYYAIFHAIRAILVLEGLDKYSKHSGVTSAFHRYYIKTGKFETRFSDVVVDSFDLRQLSDYKDFFILTKSEAAEQLANAREFVSAFADYLANLP
ncbi:MAG: HEPN domain-containing protein [Turicibacter sp.]|nr:HEPN domain-containing protein [Turicibacter sp.]